MFRKRFNNCYELLVLLGCFCFCVADGVSQISTAEVSQATTDEVSQISADEQSLSPVSDVLIIHEEERDECDEVPIDERFDCEFPDVDIDEAYCLAKECCFDGSPNAQFRCFEDPSKDGRYNRVLNEGCDGDLRHAHVIETSGADVGEGCQVWDTLWWCHNSANSYIIFDLLVDYPIEKVLIYMYNVLYQPREVAVDAGSSLDTLTQQFLFNWIPTQEWVELRGTTTIPARYWRIRFIQSISFSICVNDVQFYYPVLQAEDIDVTGRSFLATWTPEEDPDELYQTYKIEVRRVENTCSADAPEECPLVMRETGMAGYNISTVTIAGPYLLEGATNYIFVLGAYDDPLDNYQFALTHCGCSPPRDHAVLDTFLALGCYTFDREIFTGGVNFPDNSNSRCAEHCVDTADEDAEEIFSLTYLTTCFCTDDYPITRQIVDSKCNEPCPGDPDQKCGSVYTPQDPQEFVTVFRSNLYARNGFYEGDVDFPDEAKRAGAPSFFHVFQTRGGNLFLDWYDGSTCEERFEYRRIGSPIDEWNNVFTYSKELETTMQCGFHYSDIEVFEKVGVIESDNGGQIEFGKIYTFELRTNMQSETAQQYIIPSTVSYDFPAQWEAVLTGKVTSYNGSPVRDVEIIAVMNGKSFPPAYTDVTGVYDIWLSDFLQDFEQTVTVTPHLETNGVIHEFNCPHDPCESIDHRLRHDTHLSGRQKEAQKLDFIDTSVVDIFGSVFLEEPSDADIRCGEPDAFVCVYYISPPRPHNEDTDCVTTHGLGGFSLQVPMGIDVEYHVNATFPYHQIILEHDRVSTTYIYIGDVTQDLANQNFLDVSERYVEVQVAGGMTPFCNATVLDWVVAASPTNCPEIKIYLEGDQSTNPRQFSLAAQEYTFQLLNEDDPDHRSRFPVDQDGEEVEMAFNFEYLESFFLFYRPFLNLTGYENLTEPIPFVRFELHVPATLTLIPPSTYNLPDQCSGDEDFNFVLESGQDYEFTMRAEERFSDNGDFSCRVMEGDLVMNGLPQGGPLPPEGCALAETGYACSVPVEYDSFLDKSEAIFHLSPVDPSTLLRRIAFRFGSEFLMDNQTRTVLSEPQVYSIFVGGINQISDPEVIALPEHNPVFILREPPGDHSYSEFNQFSTLRVNFSVSALLKGEGQWSIPVLNKDFYHEFEIGTCPFVPVPPGIPVPVGPWWAGQVLKLNTSVAANLGVGFDLQETFTDQQLVDLTLSETLRTPGHLGIQNGDFKGHSDMYLCPSFSVLFSLAQHFEVDDECETSIKDTFMWELPEELRNLDTAEDEHAPENMFTWYTEWQILNQKLPELNRIVESIDRDCYPQCDDHDDPDLCCSDCDMKKIILSDSIEGWADTMAYNEDLKNTAVPLTGSPRLHMDTRLRSFFDDEINRDDMRADEANMNGLDDAAKLIHNQHNDKQRQKLRSKMVDKEISSEPSGHIINALNSYRQHNWHDGRRDYRMMTHKIPEYHTESYEDDGDDIEFPLELVHMLAFSGGGSSHTFTHPITPKIGMTRSVDMPIVTSSDDTTETKNFKAIFGNSLEINNFDSIKLKLPLSYGNTSIANLTLGIGPDGNTGTLNLPFGEIVSDFDGKKITINAPIKGLSNLTGGILNPDWTLELSYENGVKIENLIENLPLNREMLIGKMPFQDTRIFELVESRIGNPYERLLNELLPTSANALDDGPGFGDLDLDNLNPNFENLLREYSFGFLTLNADGLPVFDVAGIQIDPNDLPPLKVGGFSFDISSAVEPDNAMTSTDGDELSFTLQDNDVGDDITVGIFEDARGWLVFRTIGGKTSCPHEPGTIPREDFAFSIDLTTNPQGPFVTDVPLNDVVAWDIIVENRSPTGDSLPMVFAIHDNPHGLIIYENGLPFEHPRTIKVAPFLETETVFITAQRPEGEVYDFDLELSIGSQCDSGLKKIMQLTVSWVVPCPAAHFLRLDPWLTDNNDELLVTANNPLFRTNPWPPLESERSIEVYLRYRMPSPFGTDLFEPHPDFFDFAVNMTNGRRELRLTPYEDPIFRRRGTYELQFISSCQGFADTEALSEVWVGAVDDEYPEIIHFPEPQDGVWSLGDEVSFQFTEPILCEYESRLFFSDDPANFPDMQQAPHTTVCHHNGADGKITFNINDYLSRTPGMYFMATLFRIEDVHGNLNTENIFEWRFNTAEQTLEFTIKKDLDATPAISAPSITRSSLHELPDELFGSVEWDQSFDKVQLGTTTSSAELRYDLRSLASEKGYEYSLIYSIDTSEFYASLADDGDYSTISLWQHKLLDINTFSAESCSSRTSHSFTSKLHSCSPLDCTIVIRFFSTFITEHQPSLQSGVALYWKHVPESVFQFSNELTTFIGIDDPKLQLVSISSHEIDNIHTENTMESFSLDFSVMRHSREWGGITRKLEERKTADMLSSVLHLLSSASSELQMQFIYPREVSDDSPAEQACSRDPVNILVSKSGYSEGYVTLVLKAPAILQKLSFEFQGAENQAAKFAFSPHDVIAPSLYWSVKLSDDCHREFTFNISWLHFFTEDLGGCRFVDDDSSCQSTILVTSMDGDVTTTSSIKFELTSAQIGGMDVNPEELRIVANPCLEAPIIAGNTFDDCAGLASNQLCEIHCPAGSVSPQDTVKCTDGVWDTLECTERYFVTSATTFSNGWQECSARGGRLASIHSLEENEEVARLCTSFSTKCYIGLHRTLQQTFEWVDESQLDFTNWAPLQPSNLREVLETVTILDSETGLWNDFRDGSEELRAICEIGTCIPSNVFSTIPDEFQVAVEIDQCAEELSETDLAGILLSNGCEEWEAQRVDEIQDEGSLQRTWTDEHGTIIRQQEISFGDHPPVWRNADEAQNSSVPCSSIPKHATLVAEDSCDGELEVLFKETRSSEHKIRREWSASDLSGNKITHTQILILVDDIPPQFISLPPNQTVSFEDLHTEELHNIEAPTAEDACSETVEITFEYPADPEASRQSWKDKKYISVLRLWKATDSHGNTNFHEQHLVVTKTSPLRILHSNFVPAILFVFAGTLVFAVKYLRGPKDSY